ncbi:MAG: hypothetical protein FGM18_04670 [Burkholderiaceae bacterium]|nr:hypothetical protein [Burkholderiaceae bacterium]
MNRKEESFSNHAKKFALGLTATTVVMAGLMKAAQANVEELQLQGAGTLRWLGLKIYEARLFAPNRLNPTQIAQQPFALELTYARDFTGVSIADRSVDEIKKLGLGNSSQHQTWRAQMLAIFPDVRAGDRIRGIHRPGAGAQFFHNDKPIGSINDAEFAQAFFAIWLDPRTAEPSLRRDLLGLTTSARP